MRWEPTLVWWHTINDSSIWLAYLLIPIGLVYAAIKIRKDPMAGGFGIPRRIRSLAISFAFFIFFCGVGHAIDMVSVWHAMPWIKAMVGTGTAISSLVAAVLLMRHSLYLLRVMAMLKGQGREQ